MGAVTADDDNPRPFPACVKLSGEVNVSAVRRTRIADRPDFPDPVTVGRIDMIAARGTDVHREQTAFRAEGEFGGTELEEFLVLEPPVHVQQRREMADLQQNVPVDFPECDRAVFLFEHQGHSANQVCRPRNHMVGLARFQGFSFRCV